MSTESDRTVADYLGQPRPVFEGDWAKSTGEERGRHSQRVREWKAANRPIEDGSTEPDGERASATPAAGEDERDRALGRRHLRKLVNDPKTPAAVRVQAAKALAGFEDMAVTARPPSIEKLHALSDAQLEAIVAQHMG